MILSLQSFQESSSTSITSVFSFVDDSSVNMSNPGLFQAQVSHFYIYLDFWPCFASTSNLITWLILNYTSLPQTSFSCDFFVSIFPYSCIQCQYLFFMSSFLLHIQSVVKLCAVFAYFSSMYALFTFDLYCSHLSLGTHEFLEYQHSLLMGFPSCTLFSSSSLSCIKHQIDLSEPLL